MRLSKVISGGQTGVDQAVLRAAIDCGLAIGGWCPPGRGCEGGVIPPEFPVEETEQERSVDAPSLRSSQAGLGSGSVPRDSVAPFAPPLHMTTFVKGWAFSVICLISVETVGKVARVVSP